MVFISYSRKDSEFVDRLIQELDRHGFDTWIDREDIDAGDAWRAEITRAIRNCDAFILVLSPNSVQSDNVSKELALADSHKRRILPLVFDPSIIPARMEYQLAGLQRVDFSEQSFEAALGQVLEALNAPMQPDTATEMKRPKLGPPEPPVSVETTFDPKDKQPERIAPPPKRGAGRIIVLLGLGAVLLSGLCCVAIFAFRVYFGLFNIEPTARVTLANIGSSTVCYVYIVPSYSQEWGTDWLDSNEAIAPGYSKTFVLQNVGGSFHFRAEDCEHRLLNQWTNVQINPADNLEWRVSN